MPGIQIVLTAHVRCPQCTASLPIRTIGAPLWCRSCKQLVSLPLDRLRLLFDSVVNDLPFVPASKGSFVDREDAFVTAKRSKLECSHCAAALSGEALANRATRCWRTTSSRRGPSRSVAGHVDAGRATSLAVGEARAPSTSSQGN